MYIQNWKFKICCQGKNSSMDNVQKLKKIDILSQIWATIIQQIYIWSWYNLVRLLVL